jgi:hypothetical protein
MSKPVWTVVPRSMIEHAAIGMISRAKTHGEPNFVQVATV